MFMLLRNTLFSRTAESSPSSLSSSSSSSSSSSTKRKRPKEDTKQHHHSPEVCSPSPTASYSITSSWMNTRYMNFVNPTDISHKLILTTIQAMHTSPQDNKKGSTTSKQHQMDERYPPLSFPSHDSFVNNNPFPCPVRRPTILLQRHKPLQRTRWSCAQPSC